MVGYFLQNPLLLLCFITAIGVAQSNSEDKPLVQVKITRNPVAYIEPIIIKFTVGRLSDFNYANQSYNQVMIRKKGEQEWINIISREIVVTGSDILHGYDRYNEYPITEYLEVQPWLPKSCLCKEKTK